MNLDVSYDINESLLHILIEAGSHSKQEVWSNLQDMTQKCFKRLVISGKTSTWTKMKYPGTNAMLRIDVKRHNTYDLTAKERMALATIEGRVNIKLNNKHVSFTSKQVEEFLVEKILLGAE